MLFFPFCTNLGKIDRLFFDLRRFFIFGGINCPCFKMPLWFICIILAHRFMLAPCYDIPAYFMYKDIDPRAFFACAFHFQFNQSYHRPSSLRSTGNNPIHQLPFFRIVNTHTLHDYIEVHLSQFLCPNAHAVLGRHRRKAKRK